MSTRSFLLPNGLRAAFPVCCKRLREAGSWYRKLRERPKIATRVKARTRFFLATMGDPHGPREPDWANAVLQRTTYSVMNISEPIASTRVFDFDDGKRWRSKVCATFGAYLPKTSIVSRSQEVARQLRTSKAQRAENTLPSPSCAS